MIGQSSHPHPSFDDHYPLQHRILLTWRELHHVKFDYDAERGRSVAHFYYPQNLLGWGPRSHWRSD